jgi:hypothetical protein
MTHLENNFESKDCYNEKLTDLKKEREKEQAEKEGGSVQAIQSADINEE